MRKAAAIGCLALFSIAAAAQQDQQNQQGFFHGFRPVTPQGSAPAQPTPFTPPAQPAAVSGWHVISPEGGATPSAGAPAVTAAPAARPAAAYAATPETVAVPAQVSYNNGRLTVMANNSSLEQILNDTASRTGMTIEGDLPQDRVFGNFGPAPAADVLAQLLDGTGNNYVILGGARNSAPRSLVITTQSGIAPPPQPAAQASSQPAMGGDDDDDDEPQPQPQMLQPEPVQPPPLRPQGSQGTTNGVRSPQQILEEMQQRRAQSQGNGSDDQ